MKTRNASRFARLTSREYVSALSTVPVRLYHEKDLALVIAERILGWQWWRSAVTGRRCLYESAHKVPDWMTELATGDEPLVRDFTSCVESVPLYSVSYDHAMNVARRVMNGGFEFWDQRAFPDWDKALQDHRTRQAAILDQIRRRMKSRPPLPSEPKLDLFFAASPRDIVLAALAVHCELELEKATRSWKIP